MSYKNPL
ncbi:hypothetical protein CGLO_15425 [Colletotrichum gloeosporioides Cg-14]|nr:hypothetical protein CGLO_15425 [Colletotrichum gloeosporioides Cg-14]